MPHVKSGRLNGLAVTSAKRSPRAPELPTISEAGIPGFEANFGQLLLAPKGCARTQTSGRRSWSGWVCGPD